MTRRLMLTLLLLTLHVVDPGRTARAEDLELHDPCPLRFKATGFPEDGSEFLRAPFAEPNLTEISVLRPRTEGLMVFSAEATNVEALYGSYYAEAAPGTDKLAVSRLRASLEWSSAVRQTGAWEGVVDPGKYRLLIRYLSPRSGQNKGRPTVCLAVSGVFTVEKPISIHDFE